MCRYGLQRLLRRRPNKLNLGLQGLQEQFLRLDLSLNTFRDESEDIIVAPQSQFLKLYDLLRKGLRQLCIRLPYLQLRTEIFDRQMRYLAGGAEQKGHAYRIEGV
jgi:hypothetical protein